MSHISLFLRIRSNWSHVTTSLGFADVIGRRFFARDIYANAKKRKNLRLEVLFTGNRGPAASFYFAAPKFFAALRFLLFFLIVYNFLLFSFYLFLFYFYIRFFNILFYLFISIYYTVFHYFCLHCVFLFWLFLFCDMWYASEMRRRRHGDAENRSGLVVSVAEFEALVLKLHSSLEWTRSKMRVMLAIRLYFYRQRTPPWHIRPVRQASTVNLMVRAFKEKKSWINAIDWDWS